MKKRFLSFLLVVCMLATMIPFMAASASAAEEVASTEATDADYAKLYVQSGLVHAYMAYDGTSYDIAKGVWYDLVGNTNGTIGGGAYNASTNPYGWQVGADGGLYYTDPNLKSAGKTSLQWYVGTGEGQLTLPETFNVEYVASHEMRNMSQANLWVNSTVTSSAIDGSTDVLYTITMPKWNSANMMRLWVNFAGTASTKYSITFGSNAANLGYKKDITIGSDGTAGMNDGSGVYTGVTNFYVRVPAGLTVTSAKVLTNGNELSADGAFQIGSLRTLIWSNLNGGNSWGNGGGSVRWFVGNNNWNGGGAGCTIIEGEERSFLTYEGTAITMNVLKKPATVNAGTSASYTFGYGTYTKTYTPAANSAVLNNDRFIFQQALGGTAYALRIYDRELTAAEKNLNHLVDILAYTRYDIAKYNALSAETKTALTTSLAKVTFTGMTASDVDNEIARIEKTGTLDNTLYVQSGLVALFVADASADVAGKVWYNRVAGAANASLAGSWYKTADGAVRVNGNIYGTKLPNGTFLETSSGKVGNTYSMTGSYLNLGTSLLPDKDFTVQMTAAYDDIYARNFDTNLATEIWSARVGYSEGGMRFRIGYFATWCNLTGTYGTSRYTYSGASAPWQGGYGWDTDRNDFRNMAGEGAYTETITRDEADDQLSAVYKQYFDGTNKASWTFGQSSKAPTDSNYKANESAGSFYMFQGWPATVYSVAVYDRVLTAAEMRQNHAADIAEYYDLDTSAVVGDDANEVILAMFIAAAQSYKIDPANYEANKAALSVIIAPPGSMNEYDELYVQDGLTALYTAYDLDDASIDFENGVWYNKLGAAAEAGFTAALTGRKYAYDAAVSTSWGWQKGANGGFAISYTQPVWSKYVSGKTIGNIPGISLDTALIRNNEYTVEVVMELEYLLTDTGDAYTVTASTAKYGLYNAYGPTYRLGEWAAMAFVAKGHGGASFGQDRWCYHDLVWANHNGNVHGSVTPTWRANLGLDDIVTMTITQAKGTNDAGKDVSTITIRRDIDSNVNTATSNGNAYWAPGSINDFTLMNGIGGVMYAIRTYNRNLTIAEMQQNHFADIAAYHELDLTEFKKLTAEEKAQVYAYYENVQLHNTDKDSVEAYIAIISGGALADTLYVTEGLVGMFTSFAGDKGVVNLNAHMWVNLVDTTKNATIAGDNWKMNADGSFGNEQTIGKAAAKVDYFGNVWYDRDTSAYNNWTHNSYLNFGAALLPVDDFTIEIVTNYHKVGLVADDGSIVDWKSNKITNYYYRATDVATGATSAVLSATALENTDATTYELLGCSYANQNSYLSNTLADAIGYLKSFASVAGIFEGNGNYCYRWYMTNGNDGWTASGYTYPTNSKNFWEDKGGAYSTVTGSIQTKTFTRDKIYTDDVLTSVRYEIARNLAVTTYGVYPVLASSDPNYKIGRNYPTGAENQFYLFKNQPVDVYAARIYDRVLTLDEQVQNKAADLVKYYGLDLTTYKTLTDAQKAEARSELVDLGFGSDKATAQKAFDAIASAALDANGLSQYDKAYVQEGLVGLFTAYEDAEVSLSIAKQTWANKVGEGEATVLGGSNYWYRGENGGLGYHLTLDQWTSASANGFVGISLPEEFAELKNFTVEAVAETYGITNEDGSVFYNTYKAAHTDANGFQIAASGAQWGRYATTTAGYRFGLINALSWAAQYPNNSNALGYNRWMYAPGAYNQHNINANNAKWFAIFGNEGTLKSYNYAAITMQFVRSTAADGAVTFSVGANGAKATMTGTVAAAKVAELESVTGYAKDNAGAFSLFNCIPSMVYAVRVYDRALTAAEMKHNHFIDIAAYCKADLSVFNTLTAEQKANVYNYYDSVALQDANKILVEAFIDMASEGVVSYWDISGKDSTVLAKLYDLPNGNYKLVIEGNGAMKNFASNALAPWYDYRTRITAIEISNGVTNVGDYAFYNLAVGSITLSADVTTIGNSAFRWCASLESVTMTENVTYIGSYAFAYCAKMVTCNYPENATICKKAFEKCDSLEPPYQAPVLVEWDVSANGDGSVMAKLYDLYDNTYELVISGNGAMKNFAYDDFAPWYDYHAKIVSVVISDGVTNIGNYAFYNHAVRNVTLPASVTKIGNSAFRWCAMLITVSMTDNVTRIGSYAFAYCENMTTCNYPTNATIGKNAFEECISLRPPFDASAIKEWDVSANGDGSVMAKLYYLDVGYKIVIEGNGAMKSYTYDSLAPWYKYRERIHEVEVCEGVTRVGDYAFYNHALKSVTLADSVTRVGVGAFRWCSLLESVTFGAGFNSVGASAFYNCAKLTDCVLPEGAYVGKNAFVGTPLD